MLWFKLKLAAVLCVFFFHATSGLIRTKVYCFSVLCVIVWHNAVRELAQVILCLLSEALVPM